MLLVPKSLTIQLPTSKRSCGPASMRINVASAPTAAAAAPRRATNSIGRRRNPGRAGRCWSSTHGSATGSWPVPPSCTEVVVAGTTFSSDVGTASRRRACGTGAVTAATGIVASSWGGRDGGDDVVASARPTGAAAITWVTSSGRSAAGRPAELVTGTSPVFSETPRSEAPHSMQNFWPARTSTSHDGHCMPRA